MNEIEPDRLGDGLLDRGAFELLTRAAQIGMDGADGIRSGNIRIMIASDLAARGLNIPEVTHVFNLDVPTMSKAYLHRVGRTARAGAKGTAVSLVTETEARLIGRYERDLRISLQEIRVRDGRISPITARGR